MRSDFEKLLRLFVEFSDGNPAGTKIELDTFYNECKQLIVGEFLETIDAMKVADLIIIGGTPDWEGGGSYCKLTDKGVAELKIIYSIPKEVEEKSISEITEDIAGLKSLIESSEYLDTNLKGSFMDTLFEIEASFNAKCYNASIAMCGKLLETFLIAILTKHNIRLEIVHSDRNGKPLYTRTELTLKELIDLASKPPMPDNGITVDYDLISLIRKFRNGVIHYSKDNIKPTEKHLSLIVSFCLYTVRQNFMAIK